MKFMTRMLGLLVVTALLVACGGSPAEVPSPLAPSDTLKVDNAAFNEITAGWEQQVSAGLEVGMVKPETIVTDSYMTNSAIAEVVDYYNKQLGATGWTYRKRTPGLQDGVYIGGFEHGTTSLVIGAIDLDPYGATGTYVYVASGTK
jgi:hypothetical protein